jgi:protein TonB
MKPLETASTETPKIAPGDRLGAVVPELAPTSLADADLSNVIVLAHRKRTGDIEAPAIEVNDNLRPAPEMAASRRSTHWTALLAAALLLHLGLVLLFLRAPAPLPDAGLEAISVELEIGNNQPVGIAAQPSEAAEAPKPDTEQKPELAKAEPETPVEPDQPKPDEIKEPEPQLAAAQAEPDRQPPEPEALAVQEKPEPPRQEPLRDEPKPEVSEQPKPQPQKKSASKKAAPAQVAQAGGIGAGQSAALRNYSSQVVSHLSRHKRFPPEARAAGNRGVATVSFSIDGDGNVGAVSLARSSGFASLDAESQAMVQRASPFPAPPTGQTMTFTVPVNFNLR